MRIWSLVGACLALTCACGGEAPSAANEVTSPPVESTDASTPGEIDAGHDTSPDATNTPLSSISASPPPLPAGSPCDVLADVICSNEAAICCGHRGMPMDVGACRARVDRDCAMRKQQVIDGARRYDPSHLGDCLDGWRAINRSCRIPKVTILATWVHCAMMFPATTPKDAGTSCAEDADCMVYPEELGRCVEGSCRRVRMPTRNDSWNSRGHTMFNPCFPGEAACANHAAGGLGRRCRGALPLGADCGTEVDGCCAVGTYCSDWGMGPSHGTCIAAEKLGGRCSLTWPETCVTRMCTPVGPYDGVCEERPLEDPFVFDAYVASPALCFGVGSYGLVD